MTGTAALGFVWTFNLASRRSGQCVPIKSLKELVAVQQYIELLETVLGIERNAAGIRPEATKPGHLCHKY